MKMFTRNKPQRSVSFFMMPGMIVLASIIFSGCASYSEPRSSVRYDYPYHSPASSVYYEYYYYPEQNVYYDMHRHLYFYHHHSHGWVTVNTLPSYIHLRGNRRQSLRYKHNRPWTVSHPYRTDYRHDNKRRSQPVQRSPRRTERHQPHRSDPGLEQRRSQPVQRSPRRTERQ